MRFELPFRQPFAKHLVVTPVERHRVIPDLGGHVNGRVQMLQALATEELEPKGFTHEEESSKLRQWVKAINTAIRWFF